MERGLVGSLCIGRIGGAGHPDGAGIKIHVIGSQGAIVVNEALPEVGVGYKADGVPRLQQRARGQRKRFPAHGGLRSRHRPRTATPCWTPGPDARSAQASRQPWTPPGPAPSRLSAKHTPRRRQTGSLRERDFPPSTRSWLSTERSTTHGGPSPAPPQSGRGPSKYGNRS